MRYFFFGTLMDPNLLAVVLGREVADDARRAGRLHGYRCFRVAGEAFPVLVPQAGGRVDGVLVAGLGLEDARRIAWYETDDYEIRETGVSRDDGIEVLAVCCLPRPGIRHDEIAWDFESWRRHHREAALVLAQDWMGLYGTDDLPLAERSYQARKRRLLGTGD